MDKFARRSAGVKGVSKALSKSQITGNEPSQRSKRQTLNANADAENVPPLDDPTNPIIARMLAKYDEFLTISEDLKEELFVPIDRKKVAWGKDSKHKKVFYLFHIYRKMNLEHEGLIWLKKDMERYIFSNPKFPKAFLTYCNLLSYLACKLNKILEETDITDENLASCIYFISSMLEEIGSLKIPIIAELQHYRHDLARVLDWYCSQDILDKRNFRVIRSSLDTVFKKHSVPRNKQAASAAPTVSDYKALLSNYTCLGYNYCMLIDQYHQEIIVKLKRGQGIKHAYKMQQCLILCVLILNVGRFDEMQNLKADELLDAIETQADSPHVKEHHFYLVPYREHKTAAKCESPMLIVMPKFVVSYLQLVVWPILNASSTFDTVFIPMKETSAVVQSGSKSLKSLKALINKNFKASDNIINQIAGLHQIRSVATISGSNIFENQRNTSTISNPFYVDDSMVDESTAQMAGHSVRTARQSYMKLSEEQGKAKFLKNFYNFAGKYNMNFRMFAARTGGTPLVFGKKKDGFNKTINDEDDESFDVTFDDDSNTTVEDSMISETSVRGPIESDLDSETESETNETLVEASPPPNDNYPGLEPQTEASPAPSKKRASLEPEPEVPPTKKKNMSKRPPMENVSKPRKPIDINVEADTDDRPFLDF